MTKSLFLVARWFMVGVLIGTVSAVPWVLFVIWLDQTESGRGFCASQGYDVAKERCSFTVRV
jgi:hypothetical protein